MSEVVQMSDYRPPVIYTVNIHHHWDGKIEFYVEDVNDDQRSREVIASSLRLFADALDNPTETADANA